MKLGNYFFSRICSNFTLIILFTINSSALAYESLEWQQGGIFENINSNKSGFHSTASKISKTRPSKLGKAQRKKPANLSHRVKYASLGNSIEFVAPNSEIRQRGGGKPKRKPYVSRRVIWLHDRTPR